MEFPTAADEIRYLRCLLRVHEMADEILEDCLDRRLGLEAAVDAYLAQCALLVNASGGFVVVDGDREPIVRRVLGEPGMDIEEAARRPGVIATPVGTLFVARLDVSRTPIGALGLTIAGELAGREEMLQAIVHAVAEELDSAVLSFLALAGSTGVRERLAEASRAGELAAAGRIGRYEIVAPLGTGGMAQVLVARTSGPGGVTRLVALKRMLPHLVSQKPMVDQFLDEARIALRLAHPNLVVVHDFGEAAGSYYIAMEFIRGVDLRELLVASGGHLPPEVVSGILSQALEGLHAAHELRTDDGRPLLLVHRDLSPHNLMVAADGRVRVVDFGVAKAEDQISVTMPGTFKGKFSYISPEQALSNSADRRTDVFAAGLILYEAIAGRRPFARDRDIATLRAVIQEPPLPSDRIPPALLEVIERALAKRPADRYQTARELAEELTRAVPPAPPEALGRLVAERAASRLEEFVGWERTSARGRLPA